MAINLLDSLKKLVEWQRMGRWHKKKSEPSRAFGDLGGLDVTYGCNHCSYIEVKMET